MKENNDNDIAMNLLPPERIESFEMETPFISNVKAQNRNSNINVQIENKDSKKICYPSNIFSNLSFHWVYDTIKKSKKNKKLDFSYLGEVSSNFQSEKMLKDVEDKWYDKYSNLLEKNNSEIKKSIYPLFMTLIKANLCRIIIAIILYIIISVLDFLGIIMFKELLRKFKENNNNDLSNDGDETKITFLKSLSLYILILLIISHKIILLILNRQTQFIAELIGLKTTTQIGLLIYDKLLRIPSFGMNEFNEGKIINLFQTDAETLLEFFVNAGLIIIVPFKIIYSCYLLIEYFKLAFFPGIFILIILGSLFSVFRGKQKKYQKEWIKAKDERMNATSKTFDIIKILKLYSWERLFKNLINDKRKIENKANYKKLNLQVFIATINGTIETLLIMTCIIFFNLIYKQMEVDNILTSLYIIHELVEPLFQLPTFFVSLFELSISIIRIQKFLSIEDHDYSQIEYLPYKEDNSDSTYSIIISNVDFGIDKIFSNNKIIKDQKSINDKNKNNELININENIKKKNAGQ